MKQRLLPPTHKYLHEQSTFDNLTEVANMVLEIQKKEWKNHIPQYFFWNNVNTLTLALSKSLSNTIKV